MNVRGQDRHKISGRPIILHGRFVRYGTEGKIPVFQLLPGRCAVQVKADIGKRQAAGFRAFGNIQNAVRFHQQLAVNRQYAVVEPQQPVVFSLKQINVAAVLGPGDLQRHLRPVRKAGKGNRAASGLGHGLLLDLTAAVGAEGQRVQRPNRRLNVHAYRDGIAAVLLLYRRVNRVLQRRVRHCFAPRSGGFQAAQIPVQPRNIRRRILRQRLAGNVGVRNLSQIVPPSRRGHVLPAGEVFVDGELSLIRQLPDGKLRREDCFTALQMSYFRKPVTLQPWIGCRLNGGHILVGVRPLHNQPLSSNPTRR